MHELTPLEEKVLLILGVALICSSIWAFSQFTPEDVGRIIDAQNDYDYAQ